MRLAILCSGQGRQDRGMFDMLADAPAVAPILAEARGLLGRDVRALLKEASDEELHANRTSQILCVARGLAAAAIMPPGPALVAGYSVGEITAWGVAGFWSVKQTLRLTATRAALMDAAGGDDDRLGFIRRLPRDVVDTLVARHDCAISIINPNQLFVIGGPRIQVERCCAAALDMGATSARIIDVRVASHTPRLSDAVKPFLDALFSEPMQRPAAQRTLIGSADTRVIRGRPGLPGLAKQIDTTIDWAATLEALFERGATRVLELGPGTALADMVRSSQAGIEARSVDDFRTLAGVADWIAR